MDKKINFGKELIQMKIRDFRTFFIEALTPVYDAIEAESLFYLALGNKKQLKRVDLALAPETSFTTAELAEWKVVLEKLRAQIPIQYILGTAHFYGLELDVDKNVLVPRPETEELVQWILSGNQPAVKILDIGTGSGCIAVTLAKNIPDATIYALDISAEALAVAKKNAAKHNADVNFIHQDILGVQSLEKQFDIIVSNPPYVRHLEKREIKPNVIDNEPHLALFVPDADPLVFYRKITALAMKNLNRNGQLYFEINQYLAKEMMDLLETAGFQSIELRKDIYGNDRMIRATV